MFDDRLLVGGAGMAGERVARGTDLGYGGVLIGWSPRRGGSGLGRGLVGSGRGTVMLPIDGGCWWPRADPRVAAGARSRRTIRRAWPALVPGASRPFVREDFRPRAAGERQTKVTSHVSVDIAAGYRLIGMADARDALTAPPPALASNSAGRSDPTTGEVGSDTEVNASQLRGRAPGRTLALRTMVSPFGSDPE